MMIDIEPRKSEPVWSPQEPIKIDIFSGVFEEIFPVTPQLKPQDTDHGNTKT